MFITGYVRDSFDFDPGPAVFKLGGPWGDNTFILKLDSSGNFIWARSIGNQSAVYPRNFPATAATRDKNGNLYLAAQYSGHTGVLDIDPGPSVKTISFEDGDVLLEKLDSNGNLIWADQIRDGGGSSSFFPNIPTSLAVDDSSNVFMSGNFYGSADFDPGPVSYVLTSTTRYEIFVAKYDATGNFVWAEQVASSGSTEANGSAVDGFGNLLITGSFGGTVDFDPGFNVYKVTANATKSLFTLRLNRNGAFSWVRTVDESTNSYGGSVATDNAGNVYTAVAMDSLCDLHPGPHSFYMSKGVAVQELDSSGNFVWGAGWQGDVPSWIGLDNNDSIYVSGEFSGTNKDFDPGAGIFLLSGNNNGSGYIIKLKQTPVPVSIAGVGLQATNVSVYPNPSSGIVTFSSSFTIRRIELRDIAGRLVYISEPDKVKTIIDFGGTSSGVYFYEVDCGGRKQRGKLVIY
jgi:hypothetical protein